MKYIKCIFFALFFSLGLGAQVTVTTDLPAEIAKNKEITVNIKFDKGPIKNYSKYEMLVPEGIVIKELDCRYGAFSFENNKVRVIWAITPADPIYTIQVKFFSGNETGAKQIAQTYAYAEKGQKLELEMAKIKFTVVDSLMPANANNQENNSGTEVAVSESTENKIEDTKKEVAEIKNESKEGEEIGKAEKIDAEKKIAEAKEELRKAELISNPNEKKAAIEMATQKQRKAEEELAAAERILVLSNALNNNADQKEKLNQPIDSIVKADVNVSADANQQEKSAASIDHHPSEKIEKAKETAMNKGAEDAQDLYKSIKPEDHHEDLQIEQQVSQLRLDSKDALEVGTREKLKAEAAMHDAYEALKKTKYIPDAEEKKLAVDKANADIEQAKSDLEIASKILTLSKSLEDNAKEIERLHLNDEPKPASTTVAANTTVSAGTEMAKENNSAPIAAEKPVEKIQEKPVEKPADTNTQVAESVQKQNPAAPSETLAAEVNVSQSKPVEESVTVEKEKVTEAPKEKPVVAVKENKTNNNNNNIAKSGNSGNAAFTLQLGSFVNNPDLSVFKKLGKVELRNENGKYKVFYGKFSSKEEAVEMRQKTVSKGFDCFVVTLSKP